MPQQRHLLANPLNILLLKAGVLGLVLGALTLSAADAAPLVVKKSDSIVFVGNTFAERMHLFGYFETFLHGRFPDHQLKIRNLGWSADELDRMPRPKGFGDMHRYLAEHKADLIFACFGMNESFAGPAGLARFERKLRAFLDSLEQHQYNGRSGPRIVLVSPIAHETLGGRLPDGAEHNRNLRLYTQAMADAAAQHKVRFVDLFTPTHRLAMSDSAKPLTFNGIHVTEYGDWTVSQMMARSLGLTDRIAPSVSSGNATAQKLRRTVYEKNYYYFIRWRGPNAEYIHGERNRLPGAEKLPEEMAEYDRIIAAYDQRIWAMAKPRPEKIWQHAPTGEPVWVTTPRFKPDQQTKVATGVDRYEGTRLLSPQEELKTFTVPEGYAINLFASELRFPLANPEAMNFDAQGRLWVANTPTWPQPFPGEQPRDSIVVLEDNDRDGVADKHTVFIDKLDMIHGFALGHGGAYISQTPNLIHAQDTDGDGRADRVRRVLHGFGSEDVEHSMNNFKWGPGGALYFMEGIFFRTQVETPYGPRRVRNGAVFRYEPPTQRFDVLVSYSFWNPWGQVFDRWGQCILLDASSGDYHNRSLLAANFVYPKQKRRNDALSFAPEEVGPSAGVDLIRNRHFPPEAQGRFISNQLSGFRGTHWYAIKENGTTYEADWLRPHLLSSTDPWFRPVATAFGPDGALYILDFYSAVIENTSFPKRDVGRDHVRGRIWRITYKKGPKFTQPGIVGEPTPVLLDLLTAYENTTRHFARRELQERDADKVLPDLKKWIAALDTSNAEYEHHLLEALWIYQGHGIVKPELLKKMLEAKNAHARIAATRILRYWQHQIPNSIDLLAKLVEDPHPRVRLEAVLACSSSTSPRAPEVALQVAKYPMDTGMEHVLNDTMNYFERARDRPE